MEGLAMKSWEFVIVPLRILETIVNFVTSLALLVRAMTHLEDVPKIQTWFQLLLFAQI
eukprot:Awhi_evm1s11805